MTNKRDIVIIDRSFCGLGLQERTYRVRASFESLMKVYVTIDRRGGPKLFFCDPETIDQTLVILFHMEPGPILYKKVRQLTPGQSEVNKAILDQLYQSIGEKNPHHESLDGIRRISEETFLEKADRSRRATKIVLGVMRGADDERQ